MVLALIALSCVLIVPNALAGKRKELESAMMYSEAAKCYYDATVANPMNPENHYLLGLVYLKQGNDRLAQMSFTRAVALDAQQKARINPSLQYLDYSSLNEVREQLDAAATKNPSIKKKLASDIASGGRDRLVREDFAEAKKLFDFSLRYSPEMRPEIFSFISSAGERSGSKKHLYLFPFST